MHIVDTSPLRLLRLGILVSSAILVIEDWELALLEL
jgi:hypothetical protein